MDITIVKMILQKQGMCILNICHMSIFNSNFYTCIIGVIMVSEDNDKDWFGPTLLPSSPHVLEGPDNMRTASTPIRPPYGHEATTYWFVHFDASDPPSSPAESFLSPSPSPRSLSVLSHESSQSSLSSSPLSTPKDSCGVGDMWPFLIEEDSHHICKLCRYDHHFL